jgi:hypothetical protein
MFPQSLQTNSGVNRALKWSRTASFQIRLLLVYNFENVSISHTNCAKSTTLSQWFLLIAVVGLTIFLCRIGVEDSVDSK